MFLHTLKPKTRSKGKKRVGRGGKRGTYSGRGQKGQKARAGHRIKPAEREMIIRTPKLRGFSNKPKDQPAVVINLRQLNNIPDKAITLSVLVQRHLVRDMHAKVKICASGELRSSKDIVGIPVSRTAQEKIKRAGGSFNLSV